MKRKLFPIVVALALLLATVGVLVAQATPGSVIDWFVVSGGGGTASGGNVTLDSTVGQPIAGVSTGGNVSLGAGYWYAQELVNLYLPIVVR